jgi:hypothetical protein
LVQGLLLGLGSDFLQGLPQGPQPALPLPSQVRRQQGVRAYVLDEAAARRWRDGLPP